MSGTNTQNNQTTPNKSQSQPKQDVYVKPPRDLAAGGLRVVMESYDPSLDRKPTYQRPKSS